MPAKKTLRLAKFPKKSSGKQLSFSKLEAEDPTEAAPAQKLGSDSVYVQEQPKMKPALKGEETRVFVFDEKEKLITTFTAGGVVLSFGLSIGSVIIAPAWPAGGGLLATLGIISCFGAFMARESI